MDFGFTAFPAIAAICYVVAEIVKATNLDNKWLPIICMVVGGGLGILAMSNVADFPATDYFGAIAIGIVSGLAATGANQIIKQLSS